MLFSMIKRLLSSADPFKLCEFSYHDFHVDGATYLCLHRDARMTVKLYLFDERFCIANPVVAPHDHAYQFYSEVIEGVVENRKYEVSSPGEPTPARPDRPYAWTYATPLNGGAGFARAFPADLSLVSSRRYKPGEGYWTRETDIHTIAVEPGTALGLIQMDDQKPASLAFATQRPASRYYKKMDSSDYRAYQGELLERWGDL